MKITTRKAEKEDVKGIYKLIEELAKYEKAAHEVKVTEEILRKDGFETFPPLFRVLLAENEEKEILGMAFYYTAYSTWKGKIIYLDDLVVNSTYRRSGIGKKLLDELKLIAKKDNCNQIRFHVLDWNQPAISFYEKEKVMLDPEWITCKIEDIQLQ
ncbi:MAG: GNAT family N-acetyltransferase [Chitinophagaceae bacterium]|nr:MAG: GNAT family N-acetyltransferase [Chitinophagaceae bacterium]